MDQYAFRDLLHSNLLLRNQVVERPNADAKHASGLVSRMQQSAGTFEAHLRSHPASSEIAARHHPSTFASPDIATFASPDIAIQTP
jgi:hypothetical protein